MLLHSIKLKNIVVCFSNTKEKHLPLNFFKCSVNWQVLSFSPVLFRLLHVCVCVCVLCAFTDNQVMEHVNIYTCQSQMTLHEIYEKFPHVSLTKMIAINIWCIYNANIFDACWSNKLIDINYTCPYIKYKCNITYIL